MDLDALIARVGELVRGRKVVVWGGPLAGVTDLIDQLVRSGSQPPLVLADTEGVGPVPPSGSCRVVMLDLPHVSTASEEVQRWASLVERPPPGVVDAVTAYDPDHEAACLIGQFATARTFVGRLVLDGRLASWEALEDKTLSDELCDAADVRRPDSRLVAAMTNDLIEATMELDDGDGVVWSGDSSAGVNGGGDLVRHVVSPNQAVVVAAEFVGRCRRVRVAPYVVGVPCSIHGIVGPDGIAVLRPVELVVLRDESTGRFVFCGVSTWWDPPDPDRESMREFARRMGELLVDRVGYRGGFSLDGILSAEGFVATELNPRYTGGLKVLGRAMPRLPLQLVQAALVSGFDIGVDLSELESLLVAAADRDRVGVMMIATHVPDPVTSHRVPIIRDPTGQLGLAADESEGSGWLELGPGGRGAMISFRPGNTLHRGERLAPNAASVIGLAGALWGTEAADLRPASPAGIPR